MGKKSSTQEQGSSIDGFPIIMAGGRQWVDLTPSNIEVGVNGLRTIMPIEDWAHCKTTPFYEVWRRYGKI